MASERKREKRKIRKQKKRQEYIKKKEEELKHKNLDIINILKSEEYDTKPKMAKFLERYVKYIRVFNSNNIEVYPKFKYEISRAFVTFIDATELTAMVRNDNLEIFLTYDFVDIEINAKEKELLKQFLLYLFEFKFIH